MNDFTAPNGVSIYADGGRLEFEGAGVILGAERVEALREFFRADEDARLGRWRWPENPDYVVYPHKDSPNRVTVFQESSPTAAMTFWRNAPRPKIVVSDYQGASVAYFDAHPEPKPWHRPMVGDHWVLTVTDPADQTVDAYTFVGEVFELRHNYTISPLDPRIVAGRRIWPEVSE